jgi:hypothetical protein
VHNPVFFLADVMSLRDDGRRLHSMILARAELQCGALKGSVTRGYGGVVVVEEAEEQERLRATVF